MDITHLEFDVVVVGAGGSGLRATMGCAADSPRPARPVSARPWAVASRRCRTAASGWTAPWQSPGLPAARPGSRRSPAPPSGTPRNPRSR